MSSDLVDQGTIGVDVNPKTFKIGMSAIIAEDEQCTMQILGGNTRAMDEMHRGEAREALNAA